MINKEFKFVKETFTKLDGTVATAQVCNNAGATFISCGNPRERANGKMYRIGTAKFGKLVAGQEVTQQVLVLINEANYAYGMDKDVTYRTRIIAGTGNTPLFVMSHLPIAEQITDDFFAEFFDNSDIAVAVSMEQELVKPKK